MKVDGGLTMTVAPMGGGKSLYEVRKGIAHLLRGDWWVTNIPLGVFEHGAFQPLDERWAQVVARRVAPVSRRNQRRVADGLLRRYSYQEDLETALWHGVPRPLRVPGRARGRLGWDESLVALNSREWDGGRGKTKDDRNQLFENVPMLRKLNVLGNLLVQHEELLDKNARRICNWYIRVTNQRESQRFLGMRLAFLPPLFLALWYEGNKADKRDRGLRPTKIERYFRGYQAGLYDTFGLYGTTAVALDDERIVWFGEGECALPEPPTLEGAGDALPEPA